MVSSRFSLAARRCRRTRLLNLGLIRFAILVAPEAFLQDGGDLVARILEDRERLGLERDALGPVIEPVVKELADGAGYRPPILLDELFERLVQELSSSPLKPLVVIRTSSIDCVAVGAIAAMITVV